MNKSLQIINFGKREFSDFYKVNYRLWLQRLANDIIDSLVFVEHPHVILVGNQGNAKEIRFPYAMTRRVEIPVYEVDWEGDITYRGPGQLSVYPVLHLNRHGLGVEEMIGKFEQLLIHLFHQYGIKAHSIPGEKGVWVEKARIACIDLEVRQSVTRFSLAINVNPRLSLFRILQPDLNTAHGVTSLYQILKKKIDLEVLKSQFVDLFQREFGFRAEDASSF
ncbi:lipoyl(octanoyl) transferase LipB [Candidatus Formimonas warabiya]|uniref:Octanoyltransferase n=1 Tax=Formimonas warabiya TaxID=1761012 RepID=A0A3G1KWX1_FORW1|nr:lipoyl(octanoyl) transferase LipB [Candidatus Formimonas warabiya]ATW26974.1 lipoyl(octanoyl) transferase [Candidatus Formimonas warabiya]